MKKLLYLAIAGLLMPVFTGCTDTSPTHSEATVTKAEFDKIENGMSYEEVVEIIGGECSLTSESGEKDTDFYTVAYGCDGEGDLGANVSIMFQGGKLTNKAQAGLK